MFHPMFLCRYFDGLLLFLVEPMCGHGLGLGIETVSILAQAVKIAQTGVQSIHSVYISRHNSQNDEDHSFNLSSSHMHSHLSVRILSGCSRRGSLQP